MFITREKNIFNTCVQDFNCGGFALGYLEWIRLYSLHEYDFEEFQYDDTMIEEATWDSVEEIISMFEENEIRVIYSEKEVTKDEFVVYFRLSDDGDFHFLKKYHNGRIYHKPGALPICRFNGNPFEDEWSYSINYCGPIVMFAIDNKYYR